MTTNHIQKARTYRRRAVDLRKIARRLNDAEQRSILLDSAMHYDFLAECELRTYPILDASRNGQDGGLDPVEHG